MNWSEEQNMEKIINNLRGIHEELSNISDVLDYFKEFLEKVIENTEKSQG